MTGVVTTSGIRNTLDVIQLYLMSVFSKKNPHFFFFFFFALFCVVFLFLLVFVGLHCFQKFNNLQFVRHLKIVLCLQEASEN